MKFTVRDQLSTAALKLKNTAPEEWDKFVLTFCAYTDFIGDSVADADASNIMVAKGSALQCRALRNIFEECAKMKDKATP